MLTTKTEMIDLGTITQGQEVKKSFSVQNNSSQPITITAIKASCGCTTPSFKGPTTLKAKENLSVEFGFNSSGKQGSLIKSIFIYYKDANNKDQVFTQKFKVKIEPK